jgi:hypothetical protein
MRRGLPIGLSYGRGPRCMQPRSQVRVFDQDKNTVSMRGIGSSNAGLPHVNERVTHPATARFAVAAFDTWSGAHRALADLSNGTGALNNISCLGLQRVLLTALNESHPLTTAAPCELAFPGNAQLIGCTTGPVADRLADRLQSGDQTLQAALSRWLIPRHAAHLQEVVERSKIVVWVQIFDNAEEQRAYQSLLAKSSNSVGVHDLI